MPNNKTHPRILPVLIVLLVLLAGKSYGSEVFPEIFPDSQPLKNPRVYIFIGKVEKISKNHANDLIEGEFDGELDVSEVIRGHGMDIGKVAAKWSSHEKPLILSRYEPPQIARPLKTGDRVIAFSWLRDDGTAIINYLIEYSDKNRATVLGNMAPAEWSAGVQIFLILLMAGFPLIALALYLFSKFRISTRRKMRLVKAFIMGAPLLTLFSYFIYESGISIYSNIRVDLLIVWPLVIGSFLLWLIPLFEHLKGIRKDR